MDELLSSLRSDRFLTMDPNKAKELIEKAKIENIILQRKLKWRRYYITIVSFLLTFVVLSIGKYFSF